MKNLSVSNTNMKRGTLYSEGLSHAQLNAVSQTCGLSLEEIKESFARVETDPELNTQVWESILNDYPVDWRANPPANAHRFKLYGYAIPLAPPSFLDGFVESGRKDRIDEALTKNKARYFDKIIAISAHRESYEAERDQALLEADQKFEGAVRDHWVAHAKKATATGTEGDRAADTGQSVLTTAKDMYEQDTFNKFSEKRKNDLSRLTREALGSFAELNGQQIDVKIFTEYFLPALQNHSIKTPETKAASGRIKNTKGPGL